MQAARIGDVFVLVEILLRRLIGGVRRVEGQLEVKWLGWIVLVDESDRVGAEQRRGVAFFLHDRVNSGT